MYLLFLNDLAGVTKNQLLLFVTSYLSRKYRVDFMRAFGSAKAALLQIPHSGHLSGRKKKERNQPMIIDCQLILLSSTEAQGQPCSLDFFLVSGP